MEAQLLLENLILKSVREGEAKVDATELKSILDHLNNLERVLADVLRLAYVKREAA